MAKSIPPLPTPESRKRQALSRTGRARGQNAAVKEARIRQAVELQIKGFPRKDVAQISNVSPQTIAAWTKEAASKGWVEEVREKLAATHVPLSNALYEHILKADPAQLTKDGLKARELQLKAARDVMNGMGVFQKAAQKTTSVKQTVDITGYASLRLERIAAKELEARKAAEMPAETTVVDAESVEEALANVD